MLQGCLLHFHPVACSSVALTVVDNLNRLKINRHSFHLRLYFNLLKKGKDLSLYLKG